MVQRVQDDLIQNIREGDVKYATARFTVGSSSQNSAIVNIPENVDEKASLISISLRSTARLDVDYYTDSDITTNGTDMTVSNFKTGASHSTELEFEHSGDYTTGTLSGESLLPGGRGQQAVGSQIEGVRIDIAQGDSLRIEFNNPGSNEVSVAVIMVFIEKPVE